MQPIIYDVAVSADGFIAGAGNDISAFPHRGKVVDDYLSRLAEYKTVLMGRATYEFGYDFGLKPGDNPYPDATSFVVSRTIDLPTDATVSVLRNPDDARLRNIRERSPSPVYLCGGGILAASLLNMRHVQRLRLKRAPIMLGSGVHLFAGLRKPPRLRLTGQTDYGNGYLFQEFEITA